MKKVGVLVFIVIAIVLLSACSSTPEESTQEKSTDQDKAEQQEDQHSDSEEKEEEGKEAEEVSEEVKEPKYEVTEKASIVPIDSAEEKVVLITIDDAPDKYSLEMANKLKELNVNAIFFVNGHFIESEEGAQKLKKLHDMGFIIGNHTKTHANLKKITKEEQREEILSVSDRVEEIIGERPLFFRAPHGANTDYSRKLAAEEGMTLMNWTYGYDYFEPYMDANKLEQAMISGEGPEVGVDYSLLKPGANLLMHDREWTNTALPGIIKGLRDKGYKMVDPALIKTKNM
ncbi:polysaccharide deacetylase family protein [Virgibacillus halodenitrificans]|uniref:Polysaccharide deacetylase n=1 Tax=Virgibacillus halodenitrificans TaxID=1482 RepID=A0AAC9J0U2_VIRHA|nr:polysaccharide deacetylase family protein [Virgibacillus halodenitrificans]APC48765.1 polysaccharide deacetylase [Virgibacillus halodenitrificans]MCG1029790.1 polysaccharide deacetylase family protein [Virgibacillus halodenitrificans]MCJ0931347.1 polysaccharide deacetylase family protein [Virgibacillus halodenitrificans]CDQ35990.1 putative polysaccharide deacetylase PdaA precursor [Virgibacillus halodenitrificans]